MSGNVGAKNCAHWNTWQYIFPTGLATFQDDLLFPIAEKRFNPAVGFSSDSKGVEFIEQSEITNLIEGFLKVK